MKKLIAISLLVMGIALQTLTAQVVVNVNVTGDDVRGPGVIMLGDELIKILPESEDNKGKGTLELDITEPQFITFRNAWGMNHIRFYVSPGTELTIEGENNRAKIGWPGRVSQPTTITCNDGGINQFLLDYQKAYSKDYYAPFTQEDIDNKGANIVERFHAIEKNIQDELAKTNFSDEVKKEVSNYLTFFNMYGLMCIPQLVKEAGNQFEGGDAYYQLLNSLAKEDEKLYKTLYLYSEYFSMLLGEIAGVEGAEGYERALKVTKRALKFESKLIRERMVFQFTAGYIASRGIKGTEELQKLFADNVTNEVYKKELEGVFARASHISEGDISPDFNYVDVNGNMVSLKSLRGKYVYIDMWATWCGPCKKEIPFLKELEHEYAGKNIHFVSISKDRPKDIEKWKTMVKEKGMGGIQLFANGDEGFSNAYIVQGIPHFILIDKEGRALKMKAPRPSSEEIRPLLNSLEGL
ncbi:TlpA family protein disulfide reductase [Marinifilum sp.]|uniref:TlpA family protein disulfide reductase n=1 Tax=Marinifilum sp. TaxID=2033137 RepID=UPI003BAA46BF